MKNNQRSFSANEMSEKPIPERKCRFVVCRAKKDPLFYVCQCPLKEKPKPPRRRKHEKSEFSVVCEFGAWFFVIMSIACAAMWAYRNFVK